MRTTGAPCFVTMIGWPLACTASISFRQLALNSEAAIVLVVRSVLWAFMVPMSLACRVQNLHCTQNVHGYSVVTPCRILLRPWGFANRVRSEWVWMSMKPGATT